MLPLSLIVFILPADALMIRRQVRLYLICLPTFSFINPMFDMTFVAHLKL